MRAGALWLTKQPLKLEGTEPRRGRREQSWRRANSRRRYLSAFPILDNFGLGNRSPAVDYRRFQVTARIALFVLGLLGRAVGRWRLRVAIR